MSTVSIASRRAAPHKKRGGPLLAAVAVVCAGLLAAQPAFAQARALAAAAAVATAKAKKPKVHLLKKAAIRNSAVLCKAQQRRLAKAQVVSYGASVRQARQMDACTSQGANTL